MYFYIYNTYTDSSRYKRSAQSLLYKDIQALQRVLQMQNTSYVKNRLRSFIPRRHFGGLPYLDLTTQWRSCILRGLFGGLQKVVYIPKAFRWSFIYMQALQRLFQIKKTSTRSSRYRRSPIDLQDIEDLQRIFQV